MGYPDDNFAANAVRSDREHNDEFVRYVGFADWDGEEGNILWPKFLLRCRERPLAISEVREEQYSD